jgi:hypothetical protein
VEFFSRWSYSQHRKKQISKCLVFTPCDWQSMLPDLSDSILGTKVDMSKEEMLSAPAVKYAMNTSPYMSSYFSWSKQGYCLLYKNKKLIKKRQNCITLTCESPEEYWRASSLCSSWLMWLNRFSDNCKGFKKITTIINSILHTALQRKSHLLIPFLGIARHQSQFPHSCVCERFIYSQDRSKYFGCSKIDRLILEIYKSLTDLWAQELGDRTLWFCFGNKRLHGFLSGNT